MSKFRFLVFALVFSLYLGIVPFALAYPIEQIQLDPNKQDFVVGPGKTDLILKPGESRVIEITVSNRTGSDREFKVEFEDFVGSNDLSSPVVLTNDGGVNTMKGYLSVTEPVFFLRNGERSRVPVTITMPADAEPGGRYVSVLISTLTPLKKVEKEAGTAQGGVPLITQVGTLVFITVPGDAKIGGSLVDFYTKLKNTFFSYGREVIFDFVFKNTGNLHLNPYGTVSVKNIFGQEVKNLEVESWFAMPNALRLREVGLVVDPKKDDNFMLGRYTAEAKIFRGYGDGYDTKSLVFWVLPWKLLLVILLFIILLLLSVRFVVKYISTHFERTPEIPKVSDDPVESETPINPELN